MYINELRANSIVNLEFMKESSVFEVKGRVVGTYVDSAKRGHVLLETFSFKGKVLDLGNTAVKGVVFNLYANDSLGRRVCWKNVSVRLQEYKGRTFYAVMPASYHSISVFNDRRQTPRLLVQAEGYLNYKSGYQKVQMANISDSGVAFYGPEDLPVYMRECVLEFTETIDDSYHNMRIECKPVRIQRTGSLTLYGCKVLGQSHAVMTYLYAKKALNLMDKS